MVHYDLERGKKGHILHGERLIAFMFQKFSAMVNPVHDLTMIDTNQQAETKLTKTMTNPNRMFINAHFLPVIFHPEVIILVTLMHYVRSDVACKEPLGECNGFCNDICRSRHPGPGTTGSCDVTLPVPVCMCYFFCGPDPPKPPRRECTTGLGMCTTECNEACCDSKCSSLYKLGLGTCDTTGIGPVLCSCHYECNE
ncbi:hypothetical protein ACLB2K_040430 [Fragaria x ananassa]